VAALHLPSLDDPVMQEAAPIVPETRRAGTSLPSQGEAGCGIFDGAPFVMGAALPVVPGKLAKKIIRGEFVDMTELLKDNIELERRRMAAVDNIQGQRLSRREMPDFESWL